MMVTMGPSPTAIAGRSVPAGIVRLPPPGRSRPFPSPGAGATGGSDVYRIGSDGSPLRIWTSHEDIVYALAFDSRNNRLLAGTGNRGHVFAIDGPDDYSDLLKAAASQVTGFAKAPGGGLYAASSNLGKIFVLGPGPERKAPTKAMFSTPRFFPAGDAPSSVAQAMSICWPAAATSTTLTATGVPGSKLI